MIQGSAIGSSFIERCEVESEEEVVGGKSHFVRFLYQTNRYARVTSTGTLKNKDDFNPRVREQREKESRRKDSLDERTNSSC